MKWAASTAVCKEAGERSPRISAPNHPAMKAQTQRVKSLRMLDLFLTLRAMSARKRRVAAARVPTVPH